LLDLIALFALSKKTIFILSQAKLQANKNPCEVHDFEKFWPLKLKAKLNCEN